LWKRHVDSRVLVAESWPDRRGSATRWSTRYGPREASALKAAGADDEFRLLEHLAGLRNECAHADEEEPEHTEVRQLVDETAGSIDRHDR